ncbi:hypothetical protein H8356DRAFT_1752233 [Neocallimastix lanati (nom. inval.)]|nr:hypothetical protein H8356DRAFT_1758429 [Neocallimastix sp. JGI-2020a]KAG4081740.1 hypothetical protein H8356DRAFT_1756566 [Neocallimastix sp. JGI-2020a]KAG4081938.1 hypothetical protein H8356DRAFT_1755209 [Neocallimastix sp. JGI-2020a]KAG4082036.1 hypothetical protein H8356DRAFT_1754758 [Neocallimastix sp. JGI-2020a]KAG4082038.1 hypothetical protein H8356DRAFT_1754759 [Neocallimastix sp. JGI-2020a]
MIWKIIIELVPGSIVVSIPACHAGDRGSIPRLGVLPFYILFYQIMILVNLKTILIIFYIKI